MNKKNRVNKRKVPTYDNPVHIHVGKVDFDYNKCSGCMICIKICPADSLIQNNKKPSMVDAEIHECMACGDCSAICPEDAISVTRVFTCKTGLYKSIDQGDICFPRL